MLTEGQYQSMIHLTRSQKAVLKVLQKGPKRGLTPKEIIGAVGYARRTVRYALRKLLNLGIVKKVPDINRDMRTYIYTLSR